MDADEFEARQRAREWFHSMRVPPGAWTIIRVDGRSFSRFTEERFDKPFDQRFSAMMVDTAQALLTDLAGIYAYTESDEISILLNPTFDLFGRGVEKIVSISAGIASATFTHAAGEPAHFDSRIWIGQGARLSLERVSARPVSSQGGAIREPSSRTASRRSGHAMT